MTYTEGLAEILLPHEMPDFSFSSNNGSYTVTHSNALLSVQYMSAYGVFAGNDIEDDKQINYHAIEYDPPKKQETFLYSPAGGRRPEMLPRLIRYPD